MLANRLLALALISPVALALVLAVDALDAAYGVGLVGVAIVATLYALLVVVLDRRAVSGTRRESRV